MEEENLTEIYHGQKVELMTLMKRRDDLVKELESGEETLCSQEEREKVQNIVKELEKLRINLKKASKKKFKAGKRANLLAVKLESLKKQKWDLSSPLTQSQLASSSSAEALKEELEELKKALADLTSILERNQTDRESAHAQKIGNAYYFSFHSIRCSFISNVSRQIAMFEFSRQFLFENWSLFNSLLFHQFFSSKRNVCFLFPPNSI